MSSLIDQLPAGVGARGDRAPSRPRRRRRRAPDPPPGGGRRARPPAPTRQLSPAPDRHVGKQRRESPKTRQIREFCRKKINLVAIPACAAALRNSLSGIGAAARPPRRSRLLKSPASVNAGQPWRERPRARAQIASQLQLCVRDVTGAAAPGPCRRGGRRARRRRPLGGNTIAENGGMYGKQAVQVLHLAPQVVDGAADVDLALDHAGRDEQHELGPVVLQRPGCRRGRPGSGCARAAAGPPTCSPRVSLMRPPMTIVWPVWTVT